jgi:hypothetical protein
VWDLYRGDIGCRIPKVVALVPWLGRALPNLQLVLQQSLARLGCQVVGGWSSIGVMDMYTLLVDYFEDSLSQDTIFIKPIFNHARAHFSEGLCSHDHGDFLGVPSIDACLYFDRSGGLGAPLGDICSDPVPDDENSPKVVSVAVHITRDSS